MEQSIKKTLFSLLAAIMLVGCNNGETLQTYFVDHQEAPDFTSVDIPTTFVNFDNASLSPEQQEAYESVERLNFLGYRIKEDNIETYNLEKQKVLTILKDEKYVDLMEFNLNGGKVIVKSLGEDNVDEFIVFGSTSEQGFGVVRILGDDMSPEKMMTLVEALRKADIDEDQFKDVINFFK